MVRICLDSVQPVLAADHGFRKSSVLEGGLLTSVVCTLLLHYFTIGETVKVDDS